MNAREIEEGCTYVTPQGWEYLVLKFSRKDNRIEYMVTKGPREGAECGCDWDEFAHRVRRKLVGPQVIRG